MISWALGMCYDSEKELIVGTITSLLPFTTKVGRVMDLSSANRSPRTCRQSVMAADCADIVWRTRTVDIVFSTMTSFPEGPASGLAPW